MIDSAARGRRPPPRRFRAACPAPSPADTVRAGCSARPRRAHAHRRGTACFDAGEQGVRVRKTPKLALERGERRTQGLDCEIRQAARKMARPHAGTIGRQHVAETLRCAAGEKIPESLHRRRVSPAAEHEGRAFPAPLEIQPGQRFGAAEVLRQDADEQRAVRVAAVAGEAAHAVGDDAARFRRRRDDSRPGTCRRCRRRVVGAEVRRELVVPAAPRRGCPSGRAVLRAVDVGWLVFDAYADGERLSVPKRAAGFVAAARLCRVRTVPDAR